MWRASAFATLLILPVGFPASVCGGVVIDRIAVTVNRHPIKTSDIDRDVRLTEFLNQEPVRMDAAHRKASAERLVDQEILRSVIDSGDYTRASEADASGLLGQIRRDRFGNSEQRIRRELTAYGLTEDQLRAHLLWQLTVLRFIDQRFRGGVLVPDEDIRSYYDGHRTQFRETLQDAEPAIRSILEGEQVNQQFESWLTDARKRAAIRYHEEAFGERETQ